MRALHTVEEQRTPFTRPWLGSRLLSVRGPGQRPGTEQGRAGAASKGLALTSPPGSPEHACVTADSDREGGPGGRRGLPDTRTV